MARQHGGQTIVHLVSDSAAPGSLPSILSVTLSVVSGPDQGKKFSLQKNHTLIGRNNGDVQLSDRSVSSSHAAVDYADAALLIVDMQSTNGTFLNGNRIYKAEFGNQDEIMVGGTVLVAAVVRKDVVPAGKPQLEDRGFDSEARTIPGRQLPNPVISPDIEAAIEVIAGPDAGKSYRLTRLSTILGRAENADIQIKDEAISRRHCQIMIKSRNFIGLKDLASANATFLNDHQVGSVQLQNGDVISLGNSKVRFLLK